MKEKPMSWNEANVLMHALFKHERGIMPRHILYYSFMYGIGRVQA